MGSPQKTGHKEVSMGSLHYIGLDIHKKMIAFCIKALGGLLKGVLG